MPLRWGQQAERRTRAPCRPLGVPYAPSISSTEGSGIPKDDGNAYVFRNPGHAVQVSFSKLYPGKLLGGKDVSPLVQFHFHTPSEHIVVTDKYPAGKQYGAELDFVHQRDGGGLLVLGVILDDSKHYAENLILKLVCLTQITENDAYPDSTTPRVVYVEQPYRSKHCYAHCGN